MSLLVVECNFFPQNNFTRIALFQEINLKSLALIDLSSKRHDQSRSIPFQSLPNLNRSALYKREERKERKEKKGKKNLVTDLLVV